MKKASDLKVYFLHGYKGNYDECSKGKYLKERVGEYHGINMALDFPGTRMQIFNFGMYIQKEELEKYKPNHWDVIIGHSLGGGLLIKLMETELIDPKNTRIILLGASIFARFPNLKLNDHQKQFQEVIIVHGTKDTAIEFQSAEDLFKLFGEEKSMLVTVEGGTHGLTNLTRMKDEEKGSFIDLLIRPIKDIPRTIINHEKEKEKGK